AGGSTVTTAGATAPGGVDPVLIQVALGQLKAQAARNAAQQQYDQAHNRIASVAVALYLGEQLPDVTNPTSGSAAARSAFLAAILQEEQRQLHLANDALGIAEGIYNQSKQEADQLVNARAALLYASNVGPSGAARPSALAAAIQPIAAQRGPALSAGFSGASPTILGQAVLTPEEILGWYSDSGKQAHLTVPIAELVADYQRVGMADGVRWDIALAQSVVETGYFDFPSSGQVASTDNNFAGIGACDSCSHGFQYPDAATGVAAHLQLLHGYATPQPIPGPLTKLPSVAGCCPTWLALTGVWATATSYGFAILNTYRQMVVWALARRSAAAGL
ncbi:MAG: glucosaminidase domain-containing protein, partial [Actinomycetota bacterium]|nr:glucosaminidase domain-containing protein [Actinomycetota bacterium]